MFHVSLHYLWSLLGSFSLLWAQMYLKNVYSLILELSFGNLSVVLWYSYNYCCMLDCHIKYYLLKSCALQVNNYYNLGLKCTSHYQSHICYLLVIGSNVSCLSLLHHSCKEYRSIIMHSSIWMAEMLNIYKMGYIYTSYFILSLWESEWASKRQ